MINKSLLLLMEGSRRLGRLIPLKGRGRSQKALERYGASCGENASSCFVENQNCLKGLPYGLATLRWSGCGPIAAFNALCALGREASLMDVALELERDGIVLFGLGGTSPYAVRDFFTRRGLKVHLSIREAAFDGMLRAGKVFIFLYVPDRRRWLSLHYICMEKRGQIFAIHNPDGRGRAVYVRGSFETILATLTGGWGRSVMLMEIFEDKAKGDKDEPYHN